MRPVAAPLDPASPAGVAATIALGDVLDEIEAAIRSREALQHVGVPRVIARAATPRRRKAA